MTNPRCPRYEGPIELGMTFEWMDHDDPESDCLAVVIAEHMAGIGTVFELIRLGEEGDFARKWVDREPWVREQVKPVELVVKQAT